MATATSIATAINIAPLVIRIILIIVTSIVTEGAALPIIASTAILMTTGVLDDIISTATLRLSKHKQKERDINVMATKLKELNDSLRKELSYF